MIMGKKDRIHRVESRLHMLVRQRELHQSLRATMPDGLLKEIEQTEELLVLLKKSRSVHKILDLADRLSILFQ